MADEAGAIYVKIKADIDDLKKGLQTAVGQMGSFKSSTVAAGNIMSDTFKKIALEIVEFGKKSVMAFAEEELAITRLTFVVGSSATPALVKFANAQSKISIFSDDAIVALEAQLGKYGMLPSEIMAATKATIGYASLTGKALPEAANIFTQALRGSSRELSALGLKILDTDTRAQRLEKAINFLNDRFGRAGTIIKDTLHGRMEMLKNSINDLMESVGGLISSIGLPKLITEMIKLANWTNNLVVGFTKITALGIWNQIKESVSKRGIWTTWATVVVDVAKGIASIGKAAESSLPKIPGDIDPILPPLDEAVNIMEKLRSEFKKAALDSATMQVNMTEVTGMETSKRIDAARMSYEANVGFSTLMRVTMEEDLAQTTANFVGMANSAVDAFSRGVAKMIMEGGKFKDVMKQIFREFAEAAIAEITRIIVKQMILMAITRGASAGGGFPLPGRARGGMIDEPSMLIGIKSGRSVFVGEDGPEQIVPSNKSGDLGGRTSGTKSVGGSGGNGNITVIIQGQFLEASPSKWSRFIKEQIIPEIRRSTMAMPSGPFTRVRGAI
jgi:hypothetical protein